MRANAMTYPEWMESGSCASSDGDAWFADKGQGDLTRLAKRICAECPVKQLCLAYAVEERITEGIWGGVSPRPRRRMWVTAGEVHMAGEAA